MRVESPVTLAIFEANGDVGARVQVKQVATPAVDEKTLFVDNDARAIVKSIDDLDATIVQVGLR